jgi:hypothetical protein
MILLHGLIKKIHKTPRAGIDLALKLEREAMCLNSKIKAV